MENKMNVLKGQRNRAYAGLHAERRRANNAESMNGIMAIVSITTAAVAIWNFLK